MSILFVYYLKVTQRPSDPDDSITGLAIMALTVFFAFGELGNWEVSKNAYPPAKSYQSVFFNFIIIILILLISSKPFSFPSFLSLVGPPSQ